MSMFSSHLEKTMKRFVLVTLLSALACTPLLANKEEAHRVKVSFDALTVLFGAYFLNGEFKVSDNMSIYGGLQYVDSRWTVNPDVNQLPGWFIGPRLGGRWYLKDNGMSGFFMQDFLEFDLGFTYSGTTLDLGNGAVAQPRFYVLSNNLSAGYAWVTDLGFFVEAMAELGTNVFFGVPNPATFAQMNTLYARINVGWAF
jgi:hypothetical protein